MDGLTIALWMIGGLVAVGALLRLMIVRRNQIVEEWQAKVADEQKKQKKTASAEKAKH
jgi:hypothetical protein